MLIAGCSLKGLPCRTRIARLGQLLSAIVRSLQGRISSVDAVIENVSRDVNIGERRA